MAENLDIPYFDGNNMHVQDWLHLYSRVLNAQGVYESVPRLLVAASRLVGEAHQYWILLDAINRTNDGVYSSNEFYCDLRNRFHPHTVENAREREQEQLQELRKLNIPYFDGSNMQVRLWLQYYSGVLDSKDINTSVHRLLVADSRLVGEAHKYWIQLDAINRNNQGVYDYNDFCYDLTEKFEQCFDGGKELPIPYFDGTNMHVQEWLHCYGWILNGLRIYRSAQRLLVAGSRLVDEAHEYWILLDAINIDREDVYNSNDFCYDLCDRFDPVMVEEAREREQQWLKEVKNLDIPYFDGTNLHVQGWLHCYCEVLNAKNITKSVHRLLVAGSRMVGEPRKYWIQLDAVKRYNGGVYNSDEFCNDLRERFDPETREKVREREERLLKEAREREEQLLKEAREREEQLLKEAREREEQLLKEARERGEQLLKEAQERGEQLLKEAQQKEREQSRENLVGQHRHKQETENLDKIVAQIRKLFVYGPHNDGYEHFMDGLSCLFQETDSDPQVFDEMSQRTLKCRIAPDKAGHTKDGRKLLEERLQQVTEDLPGFTRSVCKKDHALMTPESHVFSLLPEWSNTMGAYLITPAMGSHFVMYLAKMQENSKSGLPPDGVERLIFVVEGSVELSDASGISHKLIVDSYAYLPPEFKHSVECHTLATLVIFERRYVSLENHISEFIVGSADKQPLLETPGEIFELRKLLPTSLPYDFNIHIMDFRPGDFLNVKEVHYNQHGLLLLEGQGIYRLGDSWYPVQAGDVIWIAPFVPQWYAALGKTRSRYLLYKDVNRNPL